MTTIASLVVAAVLMTVALVLTPTPAHTGSVGTSLQCERVSQHRIICAESGIKHYRAKRHYRNHR